MIDLNINGKVYRHPSKIEEVTLRQWVSIMSVEKEEGEAGINSNIKQFSAFSGIPVDILKTVKKKDLMYHIHVVFELMNRTDVKDDELPVSFKLGRTNYHVTQDIDNAAMAQYIDCTHYMNKMKSSPEFYAYMLAIYCTKKNEKYGSFDLIERAELMLDLNMLDALRVNAFFLTTSEDYLADSQLYLEGK
tara:strand:+ start:2151 stop:2720 length:570 start_codon:yes stop_codon:yes gene_type:complete